MRGVEQIPWLYDAVCALCEATGLARWRSWLVTGARGRALDLGCGTGRNLPLLPAGTRAVGLEPSWEALQRARRRAPEVPLVVGSAEALPFRDAAFDTVLSGLVFCSVPDPHRGLLEVRRVLRSDGQLRMLEHVRSTRAWKARLQDLLQPAWTRITGGCHPNRHTERAVEAAGFRIEDDGRRARGDMRRFAARPSVREPPGRPGRLVPDVLPSADPPPSPTEEEGMTRQRLLSLAVGTALVFTAATAGAQAPPPPPYGAPITLEQAKKIMAGAEAESKKNSWGMVITILDSGGNPVMMQRMDGTQLGSVEVARDKAWSAVAFRRPTKVFEDLVAQGGANLRILKLSGANPIEGGIPIVVDGKIIGAVGVSGGSAAQDGQVAKAGIDALK
jgi:uncharacterized protein GlcG (DUF336 family)/ubiquinone/menaquinone biosynthesis C-methylase UbiE